MRVDFSTKQLCEQIRYEINEALSDAAHQIIGVASTRVPTKSGRLRNSARVEERGANRVVIVYDEPYAGRVYWDKALKHKKGRSQWIRSMLKGKGKKIIRECLIKQLGG